MDKLSTAVYFELLTTGRMWNFGGSLAIPNEEDIKVMLKRMRDTLVERDSAYINFGGIAMIREGDTFEVYVKLGEIA